jgi:hypothetical protein
LPTEVGWCSAQGCHSRSHHHECARGRTSKFLHLRGQWEPRCFQPFPLLFVLLRANWNQCQETRFQRTECRISRWKRPQRHRSGPQLPGCPVLSFLAQGSSGWLNQWCFPSKLTLLLSHVVPFFFVISRWCSIIALTFVLLLLELSLFLCLVAAHFSRFSWLFAAWCN